MTAPKLTYDEYLISPWWRMRKAAVIRYRGERCQRCRSQRNLQLHHKTYERLFREIPEDVELLCETCHKLEHGLEPPEPAHPEPPPVEPRHVVEDQQTPPGWIIRDPAGHHVAVVFDYQVACQIRDYLNETQEKTL